MANELILIDTSILIDYYRKTNKENTVWIHLVREHFQFAISTITKFEILSGATENQQEFWRDVMELLTIIPFNDDAVTAAITINANLKRRNKKIEIADLFIAASAVSCKLRLATLNKKHFERIEELTLL